MNIDNNVEELIEYDWELKIIETYSKEDNKIIDKIKNKKFEVPKVCPKCKSPYWNVPRKNEKRK